MPAGLNPAQQDAVMTLRGPLLVLAGAGTGKTRVVTFRIAQLIKSGVAADRILAVTFTRKAAGEMQERAAELLNGGKRKRRKRGTPKPEISTFHSLCVRILRRHATHLGYPEKFTIADRGDQESHARTALREIRAPNDALKPGDLLAIISQWKMRSVTPSQAGGIAETDREHLAASAYRRYQNHLKNSGSVDFDDLLYLTEELFRKFPTLRREEAGRFDHVLVDEYQDTNHSQYEIVRGLAMGHRNLCVVGDDDQSIYSWRGAEVTHILTFNKDWPEAKTVRLEANYRSRKPIIDYANTLIVHNAHRHDKVLRPAKGGGEPPRIMQYKDELTEAKEVVFDIRRKVEQTKLRYRDVAILFRTNEQPRAFEAELRAQDVPYVLIGGMSFYDRREIRDVMAYMKLAANPDDEPSLLRVLNTPPRGIGDTARKRMMEQAVSRGVPLWRVVADFANVEGLTPAAKKGCAALVQMVESWRKDDGPVERLVNRVIDEARYRQELDRIYPDPNERDARLAALGEIVNAAASYDAKDDDDDDPTARPLDGFLEEIALGGPGDNNDKESQLDQNSVALLTLHAAKGLEFPHVYLVGMEEGILPHRRSIEAENESIDEERRLAYVGVTRAQDRLTLSLALTRRKWGKARDTLPSRFLYEMTGQAERAPHRHPKNQHTNGRRR
ncbi:ATP-dependent DNA helicase PcrA [Posidoniimonas polymericola]|uniref:DNA 3'-5' helicase n=1 Tax=Posidoniimonas polymericola TaxID=2528002 RepID=A0A5C5YPU5_9BACT|nr:UvrD-helicase domain-containing protein [Posidoniimonas polymericola]TWT76893.1 ATP-dependent DNA helicase PcrA [Posidoniimonas polymericola]